MKKKNKLRFVKTSVNNFIHCGEEYLFLLRDKTKKIDAGKLNSIGGKVEPGEDYLTALIRETEEETGYVIKPQDVKFVGVIRLEGGYEDDWIMCFFKTEVTDKKIPLGNKTDDGELLWIHKDKILNSTHEVVDDLNYCLQYILDEDSIIFANAQLSENEKIHAINISKLKRK